MRKVVVSTFVTLDGVMEEPMWTFPYWNPDVAKFKLDELMASDAQLLGRKTYEGFAEAWPDREDEAGFGQRMNSIPKYVVSTTLENPTWNNTHVISENVADAINALRNEETGGDILVGGSGQLVQFLIANDLVDEYHLVTYPIVLGKGQRLFEEGTATKLNLVESKPYGNLVVSIYQPDRTPAETPEA